MDIVQDWPQVKAHFRRSFSSSLHVSIASVSVDGQPCSTPIGSLFLNDNGTGFYFEMYPKSLPRHAVDNQNICVLGVNSSRWFWLKSLYRGKFPHFPGMKLYGTLGKRRTASTAEMARLQHRMRKTRRLKGHHYLWPSMNQIREIEFRSVSPIRFGEMTAHL